MPESMIEAPERALGRLNCDHSGFCRRIERHEIDIAQTTKVTHFMNLAGMMRSVSMSSPGTSTAVPDTSMIFAKAISKQLGGENQTRVRHLSGNGRGGNHERTHQHSSPRGTPLSALEVAIA